MQNLQWIAALAAEGTVNVPKPYPTIKGSFVATIDCPPLGKTLFATLAGWLPGRIVGATIATTIDAAWSYNGAFASTWQGLASV
jgi:hypothetical protein